MLRSVIFFCLFIFSLPAIQCQNAYFQQQVNYKINVTLNDIKHTLEGNIEIEYYNNSPDTLDKIYFHLWPNAYKDNKTAYAKQVVRHNSRDFYFSKKSDRGYISQLDFVVNNEKVNWKYNRKYEDIAVISLNQKLIPGSKIIISTPFNLKIPKVFSRLGHKDQDYFITQWYPKPAVYDKKGWHPFPYLNQGEFYSEFGNFDVNITLPSNYIIAATGELQNETEKSFIESRIALTKKYEDNLLDSKELTGKISSKEFKTVNFKALRVHDFAWFASKDFLITKDEAIMPGGNRIPTYGYYSISSSPLWRKSAFYVKRALEYYSTRIGDYAWPQATAVFGDVIAGSGMEYPMITIINTNSQAKSVDEVITHEVGHNWFYGILGNNERDNPWMDEGINTYYENSYMATYYPDNNNDRLGTNFFNLSLERCAKFLHLRKLDQPLNLTSIDYANVNFGLDVYYKTARYFKILEEFVGQKAFDQAMHSYYKQWSFKHPLPNDLKRILEHETIKDLSWLFVNLIEQNQMVDYKLKKAESSFLIVKNQTGNPVPIPISLFKDSVLLNTKWVEGIKGESDVKIDLMRADKIILDYYDILYDTHLSNNFYDKKKTFKYSRPLDLRIGGLSEDHDHQHINYLPVLGWNNCDKTTFGVGFYNDQIPGHSFRYYLLPFYSFAGKNLVGQFRAEQNFYSYHTVERFVIGVFGKSYTNSINTQLNVRYRYAKIAPYLSVEMNRWKDWSHKITYTPNFILKENPLFSLQGELIKNKEVKKSLIHTLDYTLINSNSVKQIETNIRLEQQSYNQSDHYLKVSAELNSKLYYSPKRSFDVRVFVGGFLDNTKKESNSVNNEEFARGSLSLSSSGADDYLFEGSYIGRNSTSGFFSRQVDISDGGMKFAGAFQNGQFGYSNSFIAAINLKSALPFNLPLKTPLKPYFDAGYYDDLRPINEGKSISDNIVWSGGLMFDFWNVLGFYFPIVNSKNLEDQYKDSFGSNYLKRVSFSIHLPVIRAAEIIKHISFE